MISIAFANVKGGTGKTMTTMQLSGCLSERGYKVLVIDMDPQGNITRAFLKKRPEIGMYEFLTGETNFDDILICPYPDIDTLKNIYLLPTTYDLFYFSNDNWEEKGRKFLPTELKEKLFFLKDNKDFDIVFLDTNPTISLTSINVFCYADYILGVLDASVDSIEGFQYMSEKIKTIQKYVNPKLKILGVLLNENDRRKRISKEMLDLMQNIYHDQLFQTIIPTSSAAEESRAAGLPLIEYDPRCPAAQQYAQLTGELIKKISLGGK